MIEKKLKVACIIPTYNGKKDLERLLCSLENQTASFDVIIIDSNSNDGTSELGRKNSFKFFTISSFDFNHGGTRQLMVDKNTEYDIYVFLTQDVYLESSEAINSLIRNFSDDTVGAVCGRQLPHHNADLFAQHARLFNYPDKTQIKQKSDIQELGLKVAFISNSFAAYRKSTLLSVGGFPKNIIFAEDMYVATKMILNNWKIIYDSQACCRHSHNYGIVEEFNRFFDIGVFHSQEPWIKESIGGASNEGLKFLISEIKFISVRKPHLLPSSLFRTFIKAIAYKMGKSQRLLPVILKEKLSMHKRYWRK